MLVEQARQFHEVPLDRSARERRIVDVRVEPVQRVAELVKHRGGIVPRDQHRLSRFAFHEVRVVGHDGQDLGPELFLRAVLVHPRARALACARVGIEVPQPYALAVALDLVDAHVGVIDLHIVDLYEAQAVQRIRQPEHRLADLFELQILADLGLVEIVSRPA